MRCRFDAVSLASLNYIFLQYHIINIIYIKSISACSIITNLAASNFQFNIKLDTNINSNIERY